jgi:hypothetical protein
LFCVGLISQLPGFESLELSKSSVDYLWIGLRLANNLLFGFWWARRHLLYDFRAAAARRYEPRRFVITLFPRKNPEALPVPAAANS